jgi:hypothetical protein
MKAGSGGMSQNRTLEGPLRCTGYTPDIHRVNTGVVRGVQDSRKKLGIAASRGKRFGLTGRGAKGRKRTEDRRQKTEGTPSVRSSWRGKTSREHKMASPREECPAQACNSERSRWAEAGHRVRFRLPLAGSLLYSCAPGYWADALLWRF